MDHNDALETPGNFKYVYFVQMLWFWVLFVSKLCAYLVFAIRIIVVSAFVMRVDNLLCSLF